MHIEKNDVFMKTALVLPSNKTKGATELGACKVILKKIVPDMIIRIWLV